MDEIRAKIRAREPLILKLFELGISCEDISRMTRWCSNTIGNDIRRHGGIRAFSERPKSPEVYRTVFKRYVSIVTDATTDTLTIQVREALAQWLNEASIMASINGMIAMQQQVAQPAFLPEKAAYVELIKAIYSSQCDEHGSFTTKFPTKSDAHVWKTFLAMIANGHIAVPHCPTEVIRLLATHLLHDAYDKIMPMWSQAVYAHIDELLLTLKPREAYILRHHFGIDSSKSTFRAIGTQLALTAESIRKIEGQALKAMYQSFCVEQADLHMTPVTDILERILNHHRSFRKALQTQVGVPPLTLMSLTKTIQDLKLTTRAYNCLAISSLAFVGDLLQTTEAELMKQKNFLEVQKIFHHWKFHE